MMMATCRGMSYPPAAAVRGCAASVIEAASLKRS
jgi:hypothetical protein